MKLTCSLSAWAFTGLLLVFTLSGTAQTAVPDFGNFTLEEFNLKECSFDKNADAVVIFDKALSNYDDQYSLITERRIRIKILKEKGIENGNIRIRFYSKDKFEFIRKISGITATPDEAKGTVLTKLDQKTIYTRKLNEINSEVVFALPNVKVGSIIEYQYESVMEHYGGLDDWYFQQELPVMLSSYKLYIVPNVSFNYVVKKSQFMDLSVEPDREKGSVLFEMKNIPGLRDEAYSTSPRDYLQRVTFQLASIQHRTGGESKYGNNWKELARNLIEDKYFGVQINKNVATPASVVLNSLTDPFAKMQFIHNYVRKNFEWNDIYSLYSIDGLKSVIDKKKGTAGELNLLLINMLKDAAFEVYPLLVSERWHGAVDSAYSFREQFNKVVALVYINNNKFVLDASDYVTPASMIPVNLLNTVGFVVDRKNPRFIQLNDNKRRVYNIELNGKINPDATVKTEAMVDYYDYARIGKAAQYNSNKQKYVEQFSSGATGLKIDSFDISGLENDSINLHHQMTASYSLSKSGSYYLLNYNLFTGFDKNPFLADYRFTDIDFGTKYSCVLRGKFQVPEQFTVDALPKNQVLRTGDKTLQVSREVKKNNDVIEVALAIDFNTFSFNAEDYGIVKDFFTKMIDLLNEPVVLKLKQTP